MYNNPPKYKQGSAASQNMYQPTASPMAQSSYQKAGH